MNTRWVEETQVGCKEMNAAETMNVPISLELKCYYVLQHLHELKHLPTVCKQTFAFTRPSNASIKGKDSEFQGDNSRI